MDEELVKKKIGKKEVDDAYARLQKYKEGKAALETRIVGAEEWWKNNHWQRFNSEFRNANDPQPVSAWTIIHARLFFPENSQMRIQQKSFLRWCRLYWIRIILSKYTMTALGISPKLGQPFTGSFGTKKKKTA